MNDNSQLVYSTGRGSVCPGCGQNKNSCRCKKKNPVVRGDGVVRICRETKGRKGKGVTLVAGVPLEGGDLADLARQLKNRCGAGGTIKDGVIEIQGDHRDRIVTELQGRGWTVKKSGG